MSKLRIEELQDLETDKVVRIKDIISKDDIPYVIPEEFGADYLKEDNVIEFNLIPDNSTVFLDKDYKVSKLKNTLKFIGNGSIVTSIGSLDFSSLKIKDIEDTLKRLNTFPSIEYHHVDTFGFVIIKNIQKWQLDLKSTSSNNPDNPEELKRYTARESSEIYNSPVVINASAFKNSDGSTGWGNDLVIPNGILIEEGVVKKDWEESNKATRNQAWCLMNNGEIKRFSPSTNSQEMVNQGARLGISWGAFMVENGIESPDFRSSHMFSSSNTSVTGRTIILEYWDNTLGFLVAQGVTGDKLTNENVFGFTSEEVLNKVLSLNVKSAYMTDGGGSTQCYWGNTYPVPSSDTRTRTLPSVFTISTSYIKEFNSGIIPLKCRFGEDKVSASYPPLYYTHIGNVIEFNGNCRGFYDDTDEETTKDTEFRAINKELIPRFFVPPRNSAIRGLYNSGGGQFEITNGGGELGIRLIYIYKVKDMLPPPYVAFKVSWNLENK